MPDNNIEWGQGSVNNSNDWGGAKANSTNNFGAVYDDSPSGDTNIVGGTAVVSITYPNSAYCGDASDPTPTITDNVGVGTFSSTTGLVFVSTTTGEVDLSASTAGATYIITYTDTNAATATFSFTINAFDDATFSYSDSSYAQNFPDPTPTITGITGGTFSGSTGLVIDASTGVIDLGASTIASHTITYDTTSSGSSVCPNTSTQTVNIVAELLQLDNLHSMSFDGINDYIEAGSLNILNFERTDSFSISAWVKRAGTGIDEAIVSKMLSFGSNRGYLLSIGNTNVVKFVLRNSNTGSNLLFVDSTTTITDTNWHHILITYNGSSNVSGVKIYIDGLSDTVTTSGTLSATTLSSAPFNIGAKNSDSLFANSEIDEVAVFNTNLTELEVKSIYYATETGKTADLDDLTTPPIAWYRM